MKKCSFGVSMNAALLSVMLLNGELTMNKILEKTIFNIDEVKESAVPFSEGILFKPMLHPNRQDGSAIDLQQGAPKIRHSTAQFTIKPGAGWPKTIFTISEFYFILEGTGAIEIDKVIHPVKKGDVIYIAPGLERAIKNNGKTDLVYLSITDPEWTPETEKQS